MINPAYIKRLEVATRWVSMAASAILLGLQVTRLINLQPEDSAVAESEE